MKVIQEDSLSNNKRLCRPFLSTLSFDLRLFVETSDKVFKSLCTLYRLNQINLTSPVLFKDFISPLDYPV